MPGGNRLESFGSMTRVKYPLEPLAKVRAHATDAQAAELGKAVREREKAEAARLVADAA
ncbi:MAG: hypothetical protein JWM74_6244, partial [Myxococcaceae bacterium]|nr:hypothetical protein [Myxococcaceae bacterium]